MECARSLVAFQQYFAARLDERRREPRDDILTDLINARLDGVEPLDTAEMLNILLQLLVAGNETTTNLIASAMMMLLKNPERMTALVSDASLIPNFVEQSPRMESPVQQLFREPSVDTEIGGVKIPACSIVAACYASANRDDSQHPNADRIDPRATTRPRIWLLARDCTSASARRQRGSRRGARSICCWRELKNIRLAPNRNDFTHVPSLILRELHLEFDPEPTRNRSVES